MPPAERRALLLLLALAVAGQGVRHLLTRSGEPPGQVQLLATLTAGSPLAQRDSAISRARPLGPGERVNLDAATVAEVARLPKIGIGLAKTIVAYRQEHGPFGTLEGLDLVPGVGPGLLKAIGPHVIFSGPGGQRGSGAVLPVGPCVSPTAPGCPAVPRPEPSRGVRVAPTNLNSATATELDSLPGIGPTKAAAILQYRDEHGPFATVEELSRVPGFGPAALARLRERVSVR